MTIIGYARVSTDTQSLDGQVAQLEAAGCAKVFTDTASGKDAKRPGLEALLTYLRRGDTLMVPRLDRLGRSSADLHDLLEQLDASGVDLVSMGEGIDTRTSIGRLFFGVSAALHRAGLTYVTRAQAVAR